MSIFDEYCSEINDALLKINSGISQYKISNDSALLGDLGVQYDSVVETVKQCDLEIRSHDSSERKRMTEVMSKHKATQNNTKTELDSLRFRNQKGSLTGNSIADAKRQSESQK
jgi:multidrug efflux pump subunit AcrB